VGQVEQPPASLPNASVRQTLTEGIALNTTANLCRRSNGSKVRSQWARCLVMTGSTCIYAAAPLLRFVCAV
jgi:hypothetical protein